MILMPEAFVTVPVAAITVTDILERLTTAPVFPTCDTATFNPVAFADPPVVDSEEDICTPILLNAVGVPPTPS